MNNAGTFSFPQNVANEHEAQQSLNRIFTTLAEHETDITALEISQGIQDVNITDISGRVYTLETSSTTVTGQITDLSGRVLTLETSQGVQDGQITDVSGRVQTLETSQGVQDTTLTSHGTRLTATETVANNAWTRSTNVYNQCVGVAYDTPSDTTRIFNRLEVRPTFAIQSGVSAAPQISIVNNATDPSNATQFLMLSGVEAGAWSALAQEGDNLFLSTYLAGGADAYKKGCIFTTHATVNRGFRVSFDPLVASQMIGDLNVTGRLFAPTMTLSGVDLGTTLGSLQTQISAINYHNLTTNMTANGFNITGVGTLNASTVIAGGYNVKTFLNDHNSRITTLEINRDTFMADQDGNNKVLTNLNSLELGAGTSVYSLITGGAQITAPVSGIFRIRNGQAGSTKPLDISWDSVDFNGRTLLNASVGSMYGSFPDLTITGHATNFTVMPASTTAYGSNLADMTGGNIQITAIGRYRLSISFAINTGTSGDQDFYLRTRSQTGLQSPSLVGLYSQSFTGNSNTAAGYVSGFTFNDQNGMIMDDGGNFEYRFRVKVTSGTARYNHWNLVYVFTSGTNQEVRPTFRCNNTFSIKDAIFILEKVG